MAFPATLFPHPPLYLPFSLTAGPLNIYELLKAIYYSGILYFHPIPSPCHWFLQILMSCCEPSMNFNMNPVKPSCLSPTRIYQSLIFFCSLSPTCHPSTRKGFKYLLLGSLLITCVLVTHNPLTWTHLHGKASLHYNAFHCDSIKSDLSRWRQKKQIQYDGALDSAIWHDPFIELHLGSEQVWSQMKHCNWSLLSCLGHSFEHEWTYERKSLEQLTWE